MCMSYSLWTCRLKTPPETLDELGDSLRLLDELQGKMERTESDFEPLKYDIENLSFARR